MTRDQFIQSRGRMWKHFRDRRKDYSSRQIAALRNRFDRGTAYLLDVKYDHTGKVPNPTPI